MSQRLRSWAAKRFPFVLPLILLVLSWPWAVYGFVRMLPLGRSGKRLCWILAMALGAATWVYYGAGAIAGALIFIVPVLVVLAQQLSLRPNLYADWVDEQAELATAQFEGDDVILRNYRHTVYRTLEDNDVHFLERRFDLSRVCRVDFIAVPFGGWRGVAHVFLTFGFSDGEYLAVSVEARREVGEPYSPVDGLYQQYEVIYVFGDERDLIGKRALFQKHPVHLLPMISNPESARAILTGMLEAANRLAQVPEFYHSVTNTCTSNILNHASGLESVPSRYDFRLVFPGYADGLLVETGLLEAPDSMAALREATLINSLAAAAPMDDGKAWSRALRM